MPALTLLSGFGTNTVSSLPLLWGTACALQSPFRRNTSVIWSLSATERMAVVWEARRLKSGVWQEIAVSVFYFRPSREEELVTRVYK